jgi:N-acetylmuramoyl-L-alanine amidase
VTRLLASTRSSKAIVTVVLAFAAGAALAVKTGPPRAMPVDMVVLHSTGGPTCDAATGRPVWVAAGELRENLRTIEAHPRLGIHYMVDRDGRVHASVPEHQVAHHVFKHSARSIAVELVNDGDGVDPFPDAQLSALVELLRGIVARRGIAPSGILRHSDLDTAMLPCDPRQRRKVDPGAAFPFEAVVKRVFQPR